MKHLKLLGILSISTIILVGVIVPLAIVFTKKKSNNFNRKWN